MLKKQILILILAIFLIGIATADVSCTFEKGTTAGKSFTCTSQNGCTAWIKEQYCNSFVEGRYFCKDFYYVTKLGVQTTKQITWDSQNNGYYGLTEANAEILSLGDSIYFNFNGIIDYKIKTCGVCECAFDKCSGIGVQKCFNINPATGCGTLSPTASNCLNFQETCISEFGECRIPYKIYIELGKTIGVSKSTFETNEEISVRARVDAYSSQYKNLIFTIYRGNEVVTQRSVPVVIPTVQGYYIYQDFNSLPLGNYKVVVQIEGTSYKSESDFSVSDDLCVQANFLDKTRFITNKDIVLVIETFDSSCNNYITVPNYQQKITVTPTLNDIPVQFSSAEIKTGVYHYTFNFADTGLFKADFNISIQLYPSVSVSKSQYITQPEIHIVTKFQEISDAGTHQLDFSVIDEQGMAVSPSKISVTIEDSKGIKETISGDSIKQGSEGYYFNYSFGVGVYKLTISANKDGFSSDSVSTLIDITDGGICGDGVCSGTETKLNCPGDCKDTLIYWIIGIVFVSIIGIVILILVLRRKR